MWRLITFAVFICYVCLWLFLREMPFQDLPSHVARSYFIGNLIRDPSFNSHFQFEFQFRPYILGDLLLALILQFVTIETGGTLWTIFCFISLPLGLLFYMKGRGNHPFEIIFVLLVATYLATSWFFLACYANYCIGVGLAFAALSVWDRWSQSLSSGSLSSSSLSSGSLSSSSLSSGSLSSSSAKNKIFWFLLYAVTVVTCYLFHLASFFFLGIMIFVASCVRLHNISNRYFFIIVSLLPLAVISMTHVFNEHYASDADESWAFRTVSMKIFAVGTMFVRFRYSLDIALFVFFIILLTFLVYQWLKNTPQRKEVLSKKRESLFITGSLLLGYAILPVAVGPASDVDGRALPFLFSFLALSLADGMEFDLKKNNTLLMGALFLSIINFGYLAYFLNQHNHFLKDYRTVLNQIPKHKTVLPIATRQDDGRVQTSLHLGELYSISHRGLTPYIFSQNTAGKLFGYFSYVNDMYAPNLFWYIREDKAHPVDWTKVADTYDYLIITKPYDRDRIGLDVLNQLYENRAAVVFELAKRQ